MNLIENLLFSEICKTSKALLCTGHPPARVRQIFGFAKVSGRLKKRFQTASCPMRTITLCFHKANRTYAGWAPACAGVTDIWFCKSLRPSEKKFQTAFCVMRTITLCFHKANRTYASWAPACAGVTDIWFCKSFRPSEKEVSDGLLSHAYDYALFSQS